VDNKLRFDINLAAADSSRLRISSQLLLLSSSVTRAAIDKGR
jgi:YfiR/HmsC-like